MAYMLENCATPLTAITEKLATCEHSTSEIEYSEVAGPMHSHVPNVTFSRQ